MKTIITLILVLALGAAFLLLTLPQPAHADTTRYVTKGGTGDGTSWVTASGTLQAMIDAVEATGGGTVCVASGTYTPATEVGGTGDRYKTFQMKNSVAIYGGFPSSGSPTWAQRNWETLLTVFSGDIGTPNFVDDNCYHVFYNLGSLNLDSTAVLNGVIITAGNADGPGDFEIGGGMYNDAASPTLDNCTFSNNNSTIGASGLYNRITSSPILTNCTFSSNLTEYYGSGMINMGNSNPILTNCTFIDNETTSSTGMGGAIHNMTFAPILSDCDFTGNSAGYGGCIYNDSSSPALNGCTFNGNDADEQGGGIYYKSSSPTLTDCTFSGNTATRGGGIYNNASSSNPNLTNCTFSGNSATDRGGAVYSYFSNPTVINCTFANNTAPQGAGFHNYDNSPELRNCIIWGNTPDQIYNQGTCTPVVTYSDIEGGYPGEGNIDQNPQLTGDLHLQYGSPCIDAGDNTIVPPGITTDFDGENRFVNDLQTPDTGKGNSPIVDMGADELFLPVIFVNSVASGSNNGNTWNDAFTTLQGGLEEAIEGEQIWVASGTYHPSQTYGCPCN